VALFSFAIASLFPYNPTLSLSQLSSSSDYLLFLSLGIFIAALGFEGALFPFNLWIPDVYQGAPTFVTALMAGLNKKVAFLALIEVLFLVFFAYATAFSPVLEILAVLTMFFGNLLAIAQSNVKRMFAYSSISQAGYILIGLAAAKATGISASLFYIFAHALMIIGAFAIVLFLESYNIKSIEDYTALYSKNGFIAIALTLIMLSMAGMPPLIGFFGKFLLFSSAFYSHLPLLALLGVINSFISIYYYAKVINATFAKKKARPIIASRYVLAVVASIVILIIILGIYPQPLIYLASSAADSLKYI
jgi:NADH-quinone oxidoreductase subunit N